MNKYITSFIRHGLTALGGYLTAKGVSVPPEAIDSIASGTSLLVGGVAAYVLGQVWSLKDKIKIKF